MLKLFLILGSIGIFASGIFIGAWTNGEQQRGNFFSETDENRNFRTKMAIIFSLVGVIFLGIAGLLYYL